MRVIIFLISALLISSCSTDKKKAKEHYRKAKACYETAKLKGALTEIGKAIALDHSNLDFQIMQAKIFTRADNYEQAIQILTGLLSRKFKLDTVNYNLGECYFSYGVFWLMQGNRVEEMNSYEKALSYYEFVINENQEYYDAYVEQVKMLRNLERDSEALLVLDHAIVRFPGKIALIRERGREKMYLGDFAGAMDDLNKSIESNKLDSSDFSEAYRFRGILFKKKGDLDQAINDLTKSLTFNPKDDAAFVARARCYREKGLKDKACEDYRKAADLGAVYFYEIIKDYCKE